MAPLGIPPNPPLEEWQSSTENAKYEDVISPWYDSDGHDAEPSQVDDSANDHDPELTADAPDDHGER